MREVYLIQSEHQVAGMPQRDLQRIRAITHTRCALISSVAREDRITRYFADGVSTSIAHEYNNILRDRNPDQRAIRAEELKMELDCLRGIRAQGVPITYAATEDSPDHIIANVRSVARHPGLEETCSAIIGIWELRGESVFSDPETRDALAELRDYFIYNRMKKQAPQRSILFMGTYHAMNDLKGDLEFQVYVATIYRKKDKNVVECVLPHRLKNKILRQPRTKYNIKWV